MRPRVLESVADLPSELQFACGVYVISSRQTGIVLYVGESHTGRLRQTLFRHFNRWKQDYMHKNPRAVYDRNRVTVRVYETSCSEAIERQNKLICKLKPRDNLTDTGCGNPDDPF